MPLYGHGIGVVIVWFNRRYSLQRNDWLATGADADLVKNIIEGSFDVTEDFLACR